LLLMRIGKLSAIAAPVDVTRRGNTRALQAVVRRWFMVMCRVKGCGTGVGSVAA